MNDCCYFCKSTDLIKTSFIRCNCINNPTVRLYKNNIIQYWKAFIDIDDIRYSIDSCHFNTILYKITYDNFNVEEIFEIKKFYDMPKGIDELKNLAIKFIKLSLY